MKSICLKQVFGDPCNCGTCRFESRIASKYGRGGSTSNGKSTAPRGRKLRVLDRDGWKCHYCGEFANTVDHVIPRSKGGRNSMDNLVAACGPCNYAKGDSMPKEQVGA